MISKNDLFRNYLQEKFSGTIITDSITICTKIVCSVNLITSFMI